MSSMELSIDKQGVQQLKKVRKYQVKKWKQKKLLKSIKTIISITQADDDESGAGGFEMPADEGVSRTVLQDSLADNYNSTSESGFSTVSIAVPGSILENAQSASLRAYLAGQIARAACIYKVNEVVVFDDVVEVGNEINEKESINGVPIRRSCTQLARILQYLECPQFLRKHIFPMHEDLEYAGILNPLDSPHHLRQDDKFQYREGVVTKRPGKNSHVYVGLLKDVTVDRALAPGVRVTVKLLPNKEGAKKIYGKIVAPSTPTIETGSYWGYSVRVATSIGQVISQSPYKEGYDLMIGTSDKGINVDELRTEELPKYDHALIVFGGLHGLEQAMESDPLQVSDDPQILFDYYINSCPSQGSRTIRTEEAVLITLAELRTKFLPKTFFKPTNILI